MNWNLACLYLLTDNLICFLNLNVFPVSTAVSSCHIILQKCVGCLSWHWDRPHPVRHCLSKAFWVTSVFSAASGANKGWNQYLSRVSRWRRAWQRDSGIKQQRGRSLQTATNDLGCRSNLLNALFRLTDARETRWKVHCVFMTFSAITFMWAAEREEEELAFWPSAPGLVNKR